MMVLLVAIGVITLFIALDTLSSESVIARTTIDVGNVIRNETVVLNATAQIPVSLRNLTGCAFTGTWPEIKNNSFNASSAWSNISSANYTVSACSIVASGLANAGVNLTTVNVSGYYRYTRTSDAVILVSNVTYGASNFFEQAPTLFSILGVVIIIGAIVGVVVVTMRLGKSSEGL